MRVLEQDERISGEYCSEGNIIYLNDDGELHRLDGPALIDAGTGYEAWFNNGKFHRDGGPARKCVEGTLEWWENGGIHKDDGPAVITPMGHKLWAIHGVWLREADEGKIRCMSPQIMLLLERDPEAITGITYSTLEMQEYAISVRPDLIGKIRNLHPDLKTKCSHELELAGVDL